MNHMALRKYNGSDKCAVHGITESLYYEVFQMFSKDKVQLIFEEGAAVGWIYLSLPEGSLYSGFVFLYIDPKRRRKGIGTYAYKQAEKRLKEIGCNWWSSYPESETADKFAMSVGFDYTNTNSCLVFDGNGIAASVEGIRVCRTEDYPIVPDIWSREYAAMHIRIGLPYEKKELSPAERKEEYEEFCRNLNNYFVMEINRKIVGMGSLFGDNSGIGSIAVDQAYSGRGYGTRLAAFLTNECIRRGNPKPLLYCEAGNENAMHVYQKIGYVEQSRESVAVKNRT